MNKKVLKGMKIAGNVVFYLIIVALLLFSIANIKKKDKASFANLFGYGFLTVESESMQGDGKDNFDVGDLVVVKKATQKRIAKLEVGDIITFYDSSLQQIDDGTKKTYLNTHRIVYINTQGNTTIYITQGDYNRQLLGEYVVPEFNEAGLISNPEEYAVNTMLKEMGAYEEVSASNIKGIYSGHSTGWGKFITTVDNNFFVCVVLPVIILFLVELVIVIMNIMNIRNEKQKNALAVDEESQKEELRKQILAEIEAKNKEELKKQILEELKKEQVDKDK